MDLIEDKGQAFDTAIVAYALMKIKAANAERAFLALTKKYVFLDVFFFSQTYTRISNEIECNYFFFFS